VGAERGGAERGGLGGSRARWAGGSRSGGAPLGSLVLKSVFLTIRRWLILPRGARPHGAAGGGVTSVLAKRARSARDRAIPQRARSAREGSRAFDRKCDQSRMPGRKRG